MILFSKMQGTGNDFIIIDCMKQYFNYSLNILAKYLCNRNFAIGADGVIFLFKSYKADCKMRIFNSDGTEAEMCGNGIRCVAKYLYEKEITTKKYIKIETKFDVKELELVFENKKVSNVKVKINKPIFDIRKLPVFLSKEEIHKEICDIKILIDGVEYKLYLLSLGNPHAVCFVNDFDNIDIVKVGSIIENYKYFPNKTNVEFVKIIDRNNIKIKVWERGVGETLSCGTGACASVACGIKSKFLENSVNVELDGGRLNIFMEEDDNIILSGECELVFDGKINL